MAAVHGRDSLIFLDSLGCSEKPILLSVTDVSL